MDVWGSGFLGVGLDRCLAKSTGVASVWTFGGGLGGLGL